MMLRMEKLESERFCGNCHFHNVYEYPNVVFCFKRFQQGKNAVLSTLDCCDEWELQSQECFCLRDALEKQNLKKNED